MRTMTALRSLMLSMILIVTVFVSSSFAVEWEDSPALTNMWQAISSKDNQMLLDILIGNPDAAYERASDGRGPLFWAYEFANEDALAILLLSDLDEESGDSEGKTPPEMFQGPGKASALHAKAEKKKDSFRDALEARAIQLKKEQEEMERRARELADAEDDAVEHPSEYFEDDEYSDDEDWEEMQRKAREELGKEEL